MTIKKGLFFAFAAIIVLVPIYFAVTSQNVLDSGTLYKFKPKASDPFDAYQGKFLSVNFATNEVKTKFDFDERETVYVSVGVDKEGVAFFEEAFKFPPEKKDYFETIIESVGSSGDIEIVLENGVFDVENIDTRSSVRIKIPKNMNKYFINEDDAKRIQKAFRSELSDSYMSVRIHDRQARLDDIFVEDQPILDYLDAKKK